MDKQEPINAYDLYCQALEIAVDVASPIRPSWADDGQPAQRFVAIKTIKTYTSDQISQMLESNRESMALIREGFKHECHIPIKETGNTKLLQLTTVANLFLLEAWQKTEAHNIEGAIDCMSKMMRFGVHLANGGTYMGGMFCNKVLDCATKHLSSLMNVIDYDSALKASRMLQEFLDLTPVITKAIEGEIRFSKAGIKKYFKQDDWKSSLAGVGDILSTKSDIRKNKAWLELLSKEDVLSILNDKYTHMRLQVSLPLQDAAQLPDLPKNKLTDMQSMVLSVRFALMQKQCYISMLQIAFALEAYKFKKAGYPSDLESLVPEYLESIPLDPFAESSPLRYIPNQKPYILYSVGPDGKDSKGKPIKSDISPKSNGDIVFTISAGQDPMAAIQPMPEIHKPFPSAPFTYPDDFPVWFPEFIDVNSKDLRIKLSQAQCEVLCNEYIYGILEKERVTDRRQKLHFGKVYRKAVEKLLRDPCGRDALTKQLQHDKPLVVLTTAFCCSYIDHPEALETLRQFAKGPKEDRFASVARWRLMVRDNMHKQRNSNTFPPHFSPGPTPIPLVEPFGFPTSNYPSVDPTAGIAQMDQDELTDEFVKLILEQKDMEQNPSKMVANLVSLMAIENRIAKEHSVCEAMAKLLQHEEPVVQISTAIYLVETKHPEALETLQRFAAGPEHDKFTISARRKLEDIKKSNRKKNR